MNKPCPFCGATSEPRLEWWDKYAAASCTACGACGPRIEHDPYSEECFAAFDAARAAWDRRAETP